MFIVHVVTRVISGQRRGYTLLHYGPGHLRTRGTWFRWKFDAWLNVWKTFPDFFSSILKEKVRLEKQLNSARNRQAIKIDKQQHWRRLVETLFYFPLVFFFNLLWLPSFLHTPSFLEFSWKLTLEYTRTDSNIPDAEVVGKSSLLALVSTPNMVSPALKRIVVIDPPL